MPAKWLAVIAFVLCGCAPSLRMVHQSNTYFERCHAADVDGSVKVDVKQRCWARWLEHYSTGQTPERLQYAEQRLDALNRGETVAPMPGMRSPTVDATYAPTFLATVPDENPTRTEDSAPATSEATPPVPKASPPPPVDDMPCAPVCRPRYDACVARCQDRPAACTESCGIERRTCTRACY